MVDPVPSLLFVLSNYLILKSCYLLLKVVIWFLVNSPQLTVHSPQPIPSIFFVLDSLFYYTICSTPPELWGVFGLSFPGFRPGLFVFKPAGLVPCILNPAYYILPSQQQVLLPLYFCNPSLYF